MLGSCVHLPLAFRCHVAEINKTWVSRQDQVCFGLCEWCQIQSFRNAAPSAQRGASREKGDIKLTIGGPIE